MRMILGSNVVAICTSTGKLQHLKFLLDFLKIFC